MVLLTFLIYSQSDDLDAETFLDGIVGCSVVGYFSRL